MNDRRRCAKAAALFSIKNKTAYLFRFLHKTLQSSCNHLADSRTCGPATCFHKKIRGLNQSPDRMFLFVQKAPLEERACR